MSPSKFQGGSGYLEFKYQMEEALREEGLNPENAIANPPIAKFSKRFYQQVRKLPRKKIYDYCFMGTINSKGIKNSRQWVIEFAKKNFTNKSYFLNTDDEPNWKSLGSFDYTNSGKGYNPRNNRTLTKDLQNLRYNPLENDKEYLQIMCQSKYCLCPAGDATWSFRFYEALMCRSLPIVESEYHAYRTKEESKLGYKFLLLEDFKKKINYKKLIDGNTIIFDRNHLIVDKR